MTNSRWYLMLLVAMVAAVTVSLLQTTTVSAHEGHRHPQPVAIENQAAIDLSTAETHADHAGVAVVDTAMNMVMNEQPAQHEHMMPESKAGGFFVKLGRLHPVAVHFPIALILMVALAELLNFFRPSTLYDSAARFMLVMAVITSLPTAALGWLFAQGETYDGAEAFYFWWHRFLGIGVVPLTFLALILRWRCNSSSSGRRAYALMLALLTIAISIAGYYGGTLTHGIGHFDIF